MMVRSFCFFSKKEAMIVMAVQNKQMKMALHKESKLEIYYL